MQGVFRKDNDKGFFVCNQQYLFMCLKGFKLKPKTPQIKQGQKRHKPWPIQKTIYLSRKLHTAKKFA